MQKQNNYPNPKVKIPNPNIPQLCFVKNTITRKNIIIGDYTYYDGKLGLSSFQKQVTHHYKFIDDKLIIGKFCQIAHGVKFMMNGANHKINSFSTYPFYIFGKEWANFAINKKQLTNKGNIVIGNNVWIGDNAIILPGVKIGDGAIIGAYSVVGKNIPPYCIAVGNPIQVIKKRFPKKIINHLLRIKWWD